MSKQTEEEQKLLRKEMPEVERLTDLIFGLALSIGALVLISQPPQDSVGILADVVIFSYSFFILVTVWTHYTVTLTYIRIETLSILRLNFILLFLVALEPYFFFLLTSGPKEFIGGAIDDIASMLYAIDLAALMAILAYFSDLVIKKEGRKIHKEEVTRHDVDRIVY
ncbi:MAG TPA: hypothetical protein VLU38_04990 [Methanomassiliicoccales archaeon]|nr:hypothetical protein [Methanomassiliicoccales archaeon]